MKNWTRAGHYQHNPRYFTEDFRDTSSVAEEQDSEHIVGAGGCFVAGTLVRTTRGFKPIEKVRKGDEVIGYDRYGNLEAGFVSETHVHTKEEQDSDIVTFTFGDGETLTVTGNHGIYTGDEETPFVEAETLDVGDSLLVIDGAEVVQKEITDKDVKLLRYKKKDFKVYNLTITPQHTYVAGGVLVHNGGGGKSGDGRAPIEGPNTLRSRAVVRVAEVISEGEIEGLVSESEGILFDDTPIISSSGQPNFENVSYVINYGTPDQDYLPGFNDVEAETAVGTEVVFGSPVARTLAPGTDAVRVKASLPAGLYTTDLETGDINGHTVTIKWERRHPSNTGTWEAVITDTIKGKATSIYQRDYRIPEPESAQGQAWDVRMSRVSADETKSTTRSNTFFDSFTEIQEIKLTYPNTAVVGVEVDAESTGGNIPVRSYDVKGIKVKVPTNYDPLTRTYTGVWTGEFKTAWTDNPAWVVYDLLTNTRYGLGEYIDEDTIDKFEFYDAAVYNDELVDDGDGGTEPRYTFNGQIAQQQDSWATILAVASTMRASVIAGSIITLFQDRPTPVSRLITNANVIDGTFSYSSTGLATRNTVARVTFNDPNDRYLPKTVTEEDATALARYGFNPTDVATIGCTSEGQARRIAKWFLETELNTPELCTFRGGLEIADLLPSEVIKIMDRDYAAIDIAGRVAGGSSTTEVVLDREVTLVGGETYTLSILNPSDGLVEERTVTTGAGTTDTLTVSVAFPKTGAELANSPFILESDTGVQARQFRVVSKIEDERGLYTVTCAGHDPTKYARIESGITVPAPIFSDISSQSVNPISDIEFQVEAYVSPDFGGRVKLRANWASPGSLVTKYSVQWRKDNNTFSSPLFTTEPNFEIDPITPGDFELMVVAYTARGVKSVPYLETFSFAPGTTNTMNPPLNLRVAPDIQGDNSLEFAAQDLTVLFDVNPANTDIGGINVYGGIAGYKVVWKDSLDNELDTVSLPATPNLDSDTFTVTFPFATNVGTPGGPHREVKVDVYTLTTDGAQSPTALSATLTNPFPAAPGVTFQDNPSGAFVQATPLAGDTDVAGMVVAIRDTGGDFTPVLGDVVYTGSDLATQIAYPSPLDSRSVKVAVFDSFGYDFSDLVFSTFQIQTSSPYGIQPLTALPTLPSSQYPSGVIIYLTTDEKLYRVSADGNTWLKAVDGADIDDGSIILRDKGVFGSIDASLMSANSITAANGAIEDLAVTTAKIADLNVTTLKIENGAVTNIASATVGTPGVKTPFSGTTNGNFPDFTNPVTYRQLISLPLTIDSTNSDIILWCSLDVAVESGAGQTVGSFPTWGGVTRGSEFTGARMRSSSQGVLWSGLTDIGRYGPISSRSDPGLVGWVKDYALIRAGAVTTTTGVSGPQTFYLEIFGQTDGSNSLTEYYYYECSFVVMEVKR
jgi:predicted phage tail protein